ncbi:hypothetical protein [Rickettsia endosymbiont of Nabis limbatus]|uniref:hypothetical protein n=1 Tax=Rickettsia endosymbiont of Nabis limbatus TaxID=3066268 RepID=UPI0030E10D9B
MVEKFDAKKAGKAIQDIKNEKVNPFFNKTTGSKTIHLQNKNLQYQMHLRTKQKRVMNKH